MLTMAHLKAVLSDPGKVPLPQSRLDFSDLHSLQTSKKNDMEREEWTVSVISLELNDTKNSISFNFVQVCTRCETYRPPRAHHCRICKRCIRKLDHHCTMNENDSEMFRILHEIISFQVLGSTIVLENATKNISFNF